MRNLPPSAITALQADLVTIAALVQFQLPGGSVNSSTAQQVIYSGTTFRADTGLMDVPDISQDFALSASTINLKYADSDGALEAAALASGYFEARLDIHIAIFNSETLQLLHVIPSVYRGYCDDLQPGKGAVTFSFKNHATRFDRKKGRRTNDASQHRFYPGDPGFNRLTQSSGDVL